MIVFHYHARSRVPRPRINNANGCRQSTCLLEIKQQKCNENNLHNTFDVDRIYFIDFSFVLFLPFSRSFFFHF